MLVDWVVELTKLQAGRERYREANRQTKTETKGRFFKAAHERSERRAAVRTDLAGRGTTLGFQA